MIFVVAPDSFKGSLTSRSVCDTVESALLERFPGVTVAKVPMADGGEGTVEALILATGGKRQSCWVTGPLFDKTMAAYGILGDGKTAVIEMASASGLPLIPSWRRDPFNSTTYGVGELIEDALSKGCTEFIMGIGGSATNDGGAGMVCALGARLLDKNGDDVPPGAAGLLKVESMDLTGLDPRLQNARFLVACDVNNPLCGPNGAAFIFGPQKGAKPKDLPVLDSALRNFSRVIHQYLRKDIIDIPGSGAAGGMGAGLMAFFDAHLMHGFEIVNETVGFERLLEKLKPDVVITGEGRIDAQSVMGKLPTEVARVAKKCGARVVALVGVKGEGWEQAKEAGIDAIYELKERDMTLEYSMMNASELIYEKVMKINFLPHSNP